MQRGLRARCRGRCSRSALARCTLPSHPRPLTRLKAHPTQPRGLVRWITKMAGRVADGLGGQKPTGGAHWGRPPAGQVFFSPRRFALGLASPQTFRRRPARPGRHLSLSLPPQTPAPSLRRTHRQEALAGRGDLLGLWRGGEANLVGRECFFPCGAALGWLGCCSSSDSPRAPASVPTSSFRLARSRTKNRHSTRQCALRGDPPPSPSPPPCVCTHRRDQLVAVRRLRLDGVHLDGAADAARRPAGGGSARGAGQGLHGRHVVGYGLVGWKG